MVKRFLIIVSLISALFQLRNSFATGDTSSGASSSSFSLSEISNSDHIATFLPFKNRSSIISDYLNLFRIHKVSQSFYSLFKGLIPSRFLGRIQNIVFLFCTSLPCSEVVHFNPHKGKIS